MRGIPGLHESSDILDLALNLRCAYARITLAGSQKMLDNLVKQGWFDEGLPVNRSHPTCMQPPDARRSRMITCVEESMSA